MLLDAHQDVFGPVFGHRTIPACAPRRRRGGEVLIQARKGARITVTVTRAAHG
ncbi:hypothetical protein ACFVRD_34245 [Streptomyces sp. NPDC057908]|uniref:hypothetical protein n=1 Tax=Streptomyces sp. NPDC057908 TaxID=3346276 RepID=UPI0036ECD09C